MTCITGVPGSNLCRNDCSETFRGFTQCYRQNPEKYLTLRHNRFRPYPFQFIIHHHSIPRSRRRWEDNIKMDLQEVGWGDMDWIDMAQDRDRWRALVSVVMNLRVP
jgi:hypothetical protein